MFKRFLTLGGALTVLFCLGLAALAGSTAGESRRAADPGSSCKGTSGCSMLAVRAGTIYTQSASESLPAVIKDGTMLIRNGAIVAIGADIAIPAGVRVVEYPDAVVVPGFVDAGSTMSSRYAGDETVSSKYRAIDAFDSYRKNVDLLAGGVTTRCLLPDTRRLVSGRSAVVKTAGPCRTGRILDGAGALCVNLHEGAHRPPKMQEYPLPAWSLTKIPPATPQTPSSRLSQYATLRDSFKAARDYGRAVRDGSPGIDEFDYNLEDLAATLAGNPTLRIRALRAVDIEGALRVARELGMKHVLAGCHEAHRLASLLADSGAGVVLEVPFALDRPAAEIGITPGRIEDKAGTAALLAKKGVPVALVVPAGKAPALLHEAAMAAVRAGLCPCTALTAITRTPAELLGVADRVGSLEPGKDADFVVLSGKPFTASSHVREVYVGGSSVHSCAGDQGGDALVVRAGTILTAAGEPIANGEVLIENGKITAVGRTVPHPPGARIVDGGPGSVATPGLIDGHGHLGLEGDRSVPGPEIPIAGAIVAEQENFRPVTRAGVTTVVLAPRGSHSNGSRVAAIKTAGRGRDALVVDDLAAIKLRFVGKDPLLGLSTLTTPLKKGKAYVDKWKKYADDLKKWEEEQAKKKAEAEKAAAGKKKEAGKEAPKKEEGEEKKEEEKVDPISGTWEATISGDPLPEPAKADVKLKLDADGSAISGSFTSPMIQGREDGFPLTGTLQGTHVTLTVDIETPMGAPTLEADIDREDHFAGTLAVGGRFSFDVDAVRTEREAPVIKVSSRKKKKGADGRPEAPKVVDALEPYRKLFAGEIPLLVEVSSHRDIEAAIKVVVDQYKLPLVLLGAGDAWRVTEKIGKAKAGVVASLPILGRKEKKPYCQAADLARSGLPVIFQSDAEDGARSLPVMASTAVRNGMDATAALEALTINAAKSYRIDDRVGSLQPGRDGDIVIFSGNPFDGTSRVLRVFVSGKEVTP